MEGQEDFIGKKLGEDIDEATIIKAYIIFHLILDFGPKSRIMRWK